MTPGGFGSGTFGSGTFGDPLADTAPGPFDDATPLQNELYNRLKPYHPDDVEQNYVLFKLCGALMQPFEFVDELARQPDYSVLLNLDTVSLDALLYLAQFIGIVSPPRLLDETDEDYHARVKSLVEARVGFERGRPAAMIAAAKLFLTGTKSVIITERVGGNAWQAAAATIDAETPDANAVDRALRSQKPAGIILDYLDVEHVTYAELAAAYATYGDLEATSQTYEQIKES
jgi:hypothetical protein